MNFKNKNLYIIIGVVVITIFGTLYLNERKGQKTYTPILTKNTTASEDTHEQSTNPSVEQEKIKVYITGEVNSPGVYEMDATDRVDDLIKKAEGQTENADMLAINLAAHLTDAQKIVVPAIGEQVDKSGSGAQNNSEGSKLININKADSSMLTTLPGIGNVLAGNIIKYRDENGFFNTIGDIKNVPRIGNATYENIKDLITID